MLPLVGRVVVVTGASRGDGRGIALRLGEAGATVYITGRSVRGDLAGAGVAGSTHDTADEVTQLGGVAVPVRCDHRHVFSGAGTPRVIINALW